MGDERREWCSEGLEWVQRALAEWCHAIGEGVGAVRTKRFRSASTIKKGGDDNAQASPTHPDGRAPRPDGDGSRHPPADRRARRGEEENSTEMQPMTFQQEKGKKK